MNGLINWEALQRRNMQLDMDEDAQQKCWNSYSGMYDGMAKLEKKFTQNQVEQLLLSADDSVVDIGCGPGRLSVPVAKKVKQVTAVDISEEMLATLKNGGVKHGVYSRVF